MTKLEVIQSTIIAVLAFLGIVWKYKTGKDKNEKEIELAKINKLSESYEELKKKIEEAEQARAEAEEKFQESVNRITTLQKAFLVISPYIKNAMESTPESREAYTNFEALIHKDT